MSITTSQANYGGRVQDNQQGIKQFFVSPNSTAGWIYKKVTGILYQTPADPNTPLLINNNLTVTGDLTVFGTIYNPSDERIKKNIKEIDIEQANNLFTLNPITFNYNYEGQSNDRLHYGFLAQDVEKVYPELVDDNQLLHVKSVNYQGLIPIMLAKMREMQNEIDTLKELI